MQSAKRLRRALAFRPWTNGLVCALALAGAGCSADVTRFDFPAFNLSEKGATTGALPPEPMARGGLAYSGAGPAAAEASQGVPAYTPSYNPAGERRGGVGPSSVAQPLPEVAAPQKSERAAAGGEIVRVEPGDSLYAIARRRGVPVSALIEANGLGNGSVLKPGQELRVPAAGAPLEHAQVPVRRVATITSLPGTGQPSAAPARGAGWDQRYTLQPGDSLYGIARRHNVSLAELKRRNNITDATKVRAGTVLRVPGGGEAVRASRAVEPETPAPAVTTARAVAGGGLAPTEPRLLNGPGAVREAATEPAPVAARPEPAPEAAAAVRFRWPVAGRVIQPFGAKSDGAQNDGINIAVPQGTEIHAAEGGRVAYSGNELKGYGNLILIRHDNGWVSAYAHNDALLVKQDEVIRRGQVIAKAGRTGDVEQPQLHFELRQGSKPVDPLLYLEHNPSSG
jgi:murein DD-endopeptidase MepM/ murein hydrolase activator NlpD